MDADLAFCLERFANEQMAENIKEITNLEYKLEKKRNEFTGTLKHKDTTAYRQDEELVQQFIHDLKEIEIIGTKTLKVIEVEFRKALHCTIVDIDMITQMISARNKNQQIDEALRVASNKIRHQIAQTDSELTHLLSIIDSNMSTNNSARIIIWLKQHYGYVVELCQMVGKDNDFTNQLAFSEKSPFNQSLLERIHFWKNRWQLINDFIRQFGEDEATNKHLIDTLIRMRNIKDAFQFLKEYIQRRQTERHHQNRELVRKMEFELEQQRVEQKTQALQLAHVLCQLSIGSENSSQFDQRFKQVLHQTKTSKQSVPIIIGSIKEPSVEDLPFILHLEADYNTWITNASSIQQSFCSTLCKTMQLPEHTLSIEHVEQGNVILHLIIRAPHGQLVVERILGHGRNNSSSIVELQAIQECCRKFDSRARYIILGKYDLTTENRLMDYKWNKRYVNASEYANGIYWSSSLDRSGKPYFCPEGWNRFGIKVAESKSIFDAKWGSWHVAYHGTRSQNASSILATGLHLSNGGCFIPKNHKTVYLSPSIEYSAHPRYARPWKKVTDDGKKQRYYQLVFQCRVNPKAVGNLKSETLLHDSHKTICIDKNFRNAELEWVIASDNITSEYIRNNIVCYGLMIRVIDGEPKDLPSSKWWIYSHWADY